MEGLVEFRDEDDRLISAECDLVRAPGINYDILDGNARLYVPNNSCRSVPIAGCGISMDAGMGKQLMEQIPLPVIATS